MASVVVTLRIMPEDVEVDLSKLQHHVIKEISAFCGEPNIETRHEIKPVAFGLKALEIKFLMDEKKGSTETLEKKICGIKGVKSAEAIDVRRSVG